MKVEVNRNDEMPKAGDLVIDELGLKTVLFQLLRLIKAHYNLRLMNS